MQFLEEEEKFVKPDSASDQKFRETKVLLIASLFYKKNPCEIDSRNYFDVNGKFRQINLCTLTFHMDGFDEKKRTYQRRFGY